MAARLRTIADAVVTALNAQTFSQSFTATRVWEEFESLPDLATGYDVKVRPVTSYQTELHSRSATVAEYQIECWIRAKMTADVGNDFKSHIDEAVDLVEEIREFVEPNLASSSELNPAGANWSGTEAIVVYGEQVLKRANFFESQLTFTFSDYR